MQLGGLKFRRQPIIYYFIVDFYCLKAKLVIEIDEPVHDEQEEFDWEREEYSKESGYGLFRFRNEDVEDDLESLTAGIYDLCMRRKEDNSK